MRLLLSVALCAVAINSAALVAAAPPPLAHVRPQEERVTRLLRDGAARSATLRSLVDRIEGSDVIVYLELNPRMKSNLNGMLTWMTRAGNVRYLRASISSHLGADQMIATIAHELQHVLEVTEDNSVHDESSLVALYRRIGRQNGTSSPSRWETVAAQQTGFQVRRELIGIAVATIAPATEPARW